MKLRPLARKSPLSGPHRQREDAARRPPWVGAIFLAWQAPSDGWGLPTSAATGVLDVSAARATCRASASAAVTAVTGYSSSSPSFFGQPAKCEGAHTSLPIRPSNVRHNDVDLAQEGYMAPKPEPPLLGRRKTRTPLADGISSQVGSHLSPGPPFAGFTILRMPLSARWRLPR